MDKSCVICKENGNYKCPTCLVYYCSADCCKKHRENECDVLVKRTNDAPTSSNATLQKFASADTVPLDKLQLLNNDKTLKNLLTNPHLRNVLANVDSASDPEQIMQKAMQEPLFVEFADACLQLVEPPHSD